MVGILYDQSLSQLWLDPNRTHAAGIKVFPKSVAGKPREIARLLKDKISGIVSNFL